MRILHIGLGPLGKFLVTDLVRRKLGVVGAAVDIDPNVVGRPLGEIVPEVTGTADSFVKVVPSVAAAQSAGPFDCAVVSTSSDLAKCAPTFRELLSRGISLVSTCEELLYPWLRHPALAEELNTLAIKHGAKLLGTGVNPGFLMDTLPVAVTAVCRRVNTVQVWRVQDATTRRIPFQQKIGAGLDDTEFQRRIDAGTLRHVGLGESLHFIAKYLGLKIDRWTETIVPVHATRDLTCGLGPIPRGRAAGVRQVAHGYHRDGSTERAVITMEFQAAIGQENPHDRVVIDGEPSLDVTFKGGVHGDVATSAITLNSIPSLLAAPPGLHTMATIPLVFARPRPER